MSVNRRARLEFSVLCPEICLLLASYLDSPSAPSMPNYPFPNLKTILATSDSSKILNFHNPPNMWNSSSKFPHIGQTLTQESSVNFDALHAHNLAYAKPDLSCKPKTWRYGSLPQICLISFCNDSDFISFQAIKISGWVMSINLLRTFLHTSLCFSLHFAQTQPIPTFSGPLPISLV